MAKNVAQTSQSGNWVLVDDFDVTSKSWVIDNLGIFSKVNDERGY